MDIWNPRLDGFVPESGDSCFILSLVRDQGRAIYQFQLLHHL